MVRNSRLESLSACIGQECTNYWEKSFARVFIPMKAGLVRIIVGRFKFPHERQLLAQVVQLPEQLAIANSSWETFKSSMILANLRETFSYYFGDGLFATISRRHFHIFSDLRPDSPSFIIPLLLKNFVQSRQNKGVTSLTNGQNLAAKSVSHEGLFLELISDIR